ncbi:hypothetical protein HYS97_02265 [Candidatus Daviesbacteria bacterium]|nr:hypothetical protein [Candidatus Daviesbacteria bacterium]
MKKIRFKKILRRAVPLWLVVVILFDASLIVGIGEYLFLKKKFNQDILALKEASKSPVEFVQILKQQVIPQKGYTTSLKWKSLGKELVGIGAIDKEKYQEIFTSDCNGGKEMKYLDGSWDHNIHINEQNSRFIVNTFWALGLVNKSKVMGEMRKENGEDTANFASTGGWILGSKEPMEIYSSAEIISLTDEQQELVKSIAENVYRPCCGNSTAFPDCNHGMAALGYIQLAVKEGLPEKQIYRDLLAFNSYWFPQNYVEMAAFFSRENTKWDKVDPKLALSQDYSSASGVQRIRQEISDMPGFQVEGGGGCGA